MDSKKAKILILMLVITVLTLTFGGCNNKVATTTKHDKETEKALIFDKNSTELSNETLLGVGII